MMEEETPRQELVKCVLVGDNAVGKTRLICARACRQKSSLSQLLTTHVPTVWAIDQYRIYKEVLENSWTVVDGVKVSLRLWDTFGDHHKDRRFAFGHSDVILMCFDIGRVSSLDNCREMWYHQIKRFCPNTPIILVGCKNDLRFVYKDEKYLNYCRERSPLIRQVRETDIVMPEQARAVARDLGLPYYETSVLTYFGVNQVFENAIRASLCVRRQQRFWVTNFKKVLMPALQEPFCPPRPKLPEAKVLDSVFNVDLTKLLSYQSMADVVFICSSVAFSAHRFIMASSSPLLHKILTSDMSQELPPTRSNSETSVVSSILGGSSLLTADTCNDETECLIQSEQSTPSHLSANFNNVNKLSPRNHRRFNLVRWQRRRSSAHLIPNSTRISCSVSSSVLPDYTLELKPGVFRSLNYPAFQSVRIEQYESLDSQGRLSNSVQTVLTCTKLVTPQAMNQVLEFLYAGKINPGLCSLADIKQAAEFLDIPDLFIYVGNLMKKDEAKSDQSEDKTKVDEQPEIKFKVFYRGIHELCFTEGLFHDIVFRLEDGTCLAHKPLLMARSDVMCAMFSHGDFKESSARVVNFPGVSRGSFKELLHYFYSDKVSSSVCASNCVALVELADRLCLPRLVTLVEEAVIKKLEANFEMGEDNTEDALKIMQPCQLHNAHQLADWCLAYLSQNYNHICRKFPKVLRALYPENQATLNLYRWPPVWYLKEFDNYQKLLSERKREERPKNLKRTRSNSGCLCFSNKSSKASTGRPEQV